MRPRLKGLAGDIVHPTDVVWSGRSADHHARFVELLMASDSVSRAIVGQPSLPPQAIRQPLLQQGRCKIQKRTQLDRHEAA
jgi:hypothetical protein